MIANMDVIIVVILICILYIQGLNIVANKIAMNSDLPIYFAFCIYGNGQLYCHGLHENIKRINAALPNSTILISYKDDVDVQHINTYKSYNNVVLLPICNSDTLPVFSRILSFDTVKEGYIFSRDADSRVSARDIWCIKSFIESGKVFHIIRDHIYHKKRIMAGMFGVKKTIQDTQCFSNIMHALNNWPNRGDGAYGTDEEFLERVVYPQYKNDCLIHTNVLAYEGETICNIDAEQQDDYDFVGNCYDYNGTNNTFVPRFSYSKYITHDHVNWLQSQKQFRIIAYVSRHFDIHSIQWGNRGAIIKIFIMANYYLHRLDDVLRCCEMYKYARIDDAVIKLSNIILHKLRTKYTLIASFDPDRQPSDNEFIIQYGEYPHNVEYLPTCSTRVIYRHPIYFNDVFHDKVEYHPSWENIDVIYILNLVERKDRYMHLLVDLCRVHAPLHRISHYKAQKKAISGNWMRDAYIGATKNHLDVVDDFIKNKYANCLILEDDITFTSNKRLMWSNLDTFFHRKYDFDICFIGYSKNGEVRDYDDILSHSLQECTTSSAYILTQSSCGHVQECLKTGYDKMMAGESTNTYCCDRYWAILQPRRKFFVFTRKVAYQRITYSDIVRHINYNFD